MTYWHFDILTFWCFDIFIFWHFDILTFWHFDILAFWYFDIFIFWHFDIWHFDIWHCWHLTLLTFDIWHLTLYQLVNSMDLRDDSASKIVKWVEKLPTNNFHVAQSDHSHKHICRNLTHVHSCIGIRQTL